MQMSDFKAKMHHIRFRLGLHPDPADELTALSQTPWLDFRGTTSKGREGREGKTGGEEGNWKGRGGKGGEGEGKGRGRVPLLSLPVPLQLAVAGDATGHGWKEPGL